MGLPQITTPVDSLDDLHGFAADLEENIHHIISESEMVKARSLDAARVLFRLGHRSLVGSSSSSDDQAVVMEELFTDGLDSEQIWAQLSMRIDSVFARVDSLNLDDLSDSDVAENEVLSEGEVYEESIGYIEEDGDGFEEIGFDDMDSSYSSEAEVDAAEDSGNVVMSLSNENEQEFGEHDDDDIGEPQEEVEDQFLSLNELEDFADGDLHDEEEDFDYTQEIEANEDGDEDGEDGDDYNLMYQDFFEAPEGKKKKRVFPSDRPAPVEAEESSEDEQPTKKPSNLLAEESEDDAANEDLTTFQKQQLKIQKQVAKLEEENLQGRNWQLMGEVNVRDRPKNSLLEEDLDFEAATKPVPIITEEVTNSLEDMIKQRVADSLFDDVERRYASTTQAQKEKEMIELDDSKPTQSLSKVYESEYQQQKESEERKSESKKDQQHKVMPEHVEIDKLFAELRGKLDELSNWNYTPQPVVTELSVKSQDVSAIEMEEAMPSAMNTESQLAPQEIYATKKTDIELKTTEDLTHDDKTKLRKAKRARLAKEKRRRESEKKILDKANPGMGNKHAKSKILEDLAKSDNVTVLKRGGDSQGLKKATQHVAFDAKKLKL